LQWLILTLSEVEFVIPSNDDASKSIDKILSLVTAIVEGLSDRTDKEADATESGSSSS
jgi:small subunit ribosomal protein S2